MSLHYGQTNLVIPEIDNDPAILKVIHDGEKLERESYRKELLQILKIQPKLNSDDDQMVSQALNNSSTQESNQTTPASQREFDHRPSQIWMKRTVPTTPNSNSNSYRRQNYRSGLNQRSLNSSAESLHNRSFNDSPRYSNQSFNRSIRSDLNVRLSPVTNNKPTLAQGHVNSSNKNVSWTPTGVIVTDYRQSMMMKRIVNPQWNIIPFT